MLLLDVIFLSNKSRKKNASQKGCETSARTSKVMFCLSKVLCYFYPLDSKIKQLKLLANFLGSRHDGCLKTGEAVEMAQIDGTRTAAKTLGLQTRSRMCLKSLFFAKQTFRMKTHKKNHFQIILKSLSCNVTKMFPKTCFWYAR